MPNDSYAHVKEKYAPKYAVAGTNDEIMGFLSRFPSVDPHILPPETPGRLDMHIYEI